LIAERGGTYAQWVWSNGLQNRSNQINIAVAGPHTISIWRRELNHRLDAT
jgi:hypothetical protein